MEGTTGVSISDLGIIVKSGASPVRAGLRILKRMAVRTAINGFGRIGRAAFKIALEKPELEVVAINDLTEPKTLTHLLMYDTVYGRYAKEASADASGLVIEDRRYAVYAEKDPGTLPWKDLEVDVVLECTGFFTTREKASTHLTAGAKRVVISAPSESLDVDTILLGVNEDRLTTQDIVANGSCTTNCVTPVLAVLEEEFGVEKAMMTSVHAVTATQNLVDGPNKDLRRARAAPWNIVPTSTGASEATIRAFPAMEGRFTGISVRVPIAAVSMADFVVLAKKRVTAEQVNDAFRASAAQGQYEGILSVTDAPAVSSDFIGDPHSAIVDLGMTQVVGGNLLKVVAWYDNEWGYANRLVEQAIAVGRTIGHG